jgi:hypothetical protein
MIEMEESSIAVFSSNGLVQIRLDRTELSGGIVTLRFHPEAAGVIARAMRDSAWEARRSGQADSSNSFRFEVHLAPDDFVLLKYRPAERTNDVFLNPDNADICAAEMLAASEAARIRRIQKETN